MWAPQQLTSADATCSWHSNASNSEKLPRAAKCQISCVILAGCATSAAHLQLIRHPAALVRIPLRRTAAFSASTIPHVAGSCFTLFHHCSGGAPCKLTCFPAAAPVSAALPPGKRSSPSSVLPPAPNYNWWSTRAAIQYCTGSEADVMHIRSHFLDWLCLQCLKHHVMVFWRRTGAHAHRRPADL